jgi:hypothetical protein
MDPFDVELKHGRKDGSSFGKVKGSPYLMNTGSIFCYGWWYFSQKRYDESLQIEKKSTEESLQIWILITW